MSNRRVDDLRSDVIRLMDGFRSDMNARFSDMNARFLEVSSRLDRIEKQMISGQDNTGASQQVQKTV